MKPKTLDDLEKWEGDIAHSLPLIPKKDLREAAIEDIKQLRLMDSQGPIKIFPWITTISYDKGAINAVIGYIKWKFNITENELKGGKE